jgi:thymidine phosphorylase
MSDKVTLDLDGTEVRRSDPLAIVHARSRDDAARAAEAVRRAYGIVDERPQTRKPVLERITG